MSYGLYCSYCYKKTLEFETLDQLDITIPLNDIFYLTCKHCGEVSECEIKVETTITTSYKKKYEFINQGETENIGY